MNKKLSIIILVIALALVGCSNNKPNENVEVITEPVVVEVEINWEALNELEAVEAFLSEKDIVLETGYETIYLNINDNDIDELFILPVTSGIVYCLTLDTEGQYEMIETEIEANTLSTIKLEGEFFWVETQVETPATIANELMIYKLEENAIIDVLKKPIKLEEKALVDTDFMCYEESSRNIEMINGLTEFKVDLTSQFIDEFENAYDFKDTEYIYTYDAEKKEYTSTRSNNSKYSSLKKLRADVNYYGTDDSLSTFDDIYTSTDLLGAVNYYYEHRAEFVEGQKEAFANAIISKILEVKRYYDEVAVDAFNNIEVIEEENLSFTFLRNEGQVDIKDQSIIAYYKTYEISDGKVKELGYREAYKNHELSKQIRAALLDADMFVNRDLILAYRIHADDGENTAAYNPNIITTTDQLDTFDTSIKAKLYVPMSLINEPSEWLDIRDFKKGATYNDFKLSYLSIEEEHFNLNFQGEYNIEGQLTYNSTYQSYLLDIENPAPLHISLRYPDDFFRADVLTGIHSIDSDNLEKLLDDETIQLVRSGESVAIEGEIFIYLFSGFVGSQAEGNWPHIVFDAVMTQ